jgi:hypothetical protein
LELERRYFLQLLSTKAKERILPAVIRATLRGGVGEEKEDEKREYGGIGGDGG